MRKTGEISQYNYFPKPYNLGFLVFETETWIIFIIFLLGNSFYLYNDKLKIPLRC